MLLHAGIVRGRVLQERGVRAIANIAAAKVILVLLLLLMRRVYTAGSRGELLSQVVCQ